MALHKSVVGKKYSSAPFEVTAHESIYYALAYNEDNDAYFDNRRDGGIIAPPMYAVRYAAEPVMHIVLDKEVGINFKQVLHYTQEFEWIRPVRPGDTVTNEAEITHVEVRQKGGILGWTTDTKNSQGEVVTRSRWEFFDRSAGDPSVAKVVPDSPEPGPVKFEQDMTVRNGQTYIYAEPSGDHNPIHVDNDFAVKVGLPGIILQGLCTMAFAHKVVVDNLCKDRDPERLRRLRVQFSKPVIPGQTITYKGFEINREGEATRYGIIAQNPEGEDVLRNAWCVVE